MGVERSLLEQEQDRVATVQFKENLCEAKDEDERFALRSKAAAREAGEGPWGD